jgi:hypothetical protein
MYMYTIGRATVRRSASGSQSGSRVSASAHILTPECAIRPVWVLGAVRETELSRVSEGVC